MVEAYYKDLIYVNLKINRNIAMLFFDTELIFMIYKSNILK